jgi:hypothetical protein
MNDRGMSMINGNQYRSVFPWLIAGIVAALFLTIEFMHPYFFLQDDNRDYFFPHIVHSVKALLNGELALFNFHQYLGTAKLACSEAAVLYPPYYLGYFLSQLFTGDTFATMECIALMHLMLAAIGFYRLMLLFDLEPVSCMFSGIAWAFCGFVMIVGNSWLHYTGYAAFLPWIFFYAIRYCRTGSFGDFLLLTVLRGGTCTLGQPQLFAYMVVFEFILAAGWLATLDKTRTASDDGSAHLTRSVSGTSGILKYYLISFPLSLALAAPILLPTLQQANISSTRSVVLDWQKYSELSYDLKLWIHGLITPLTDTAESGWSEQGFISHIGYLTLFFIVIAWFRYREQRHTVLFLSAVALFALLWSSDTFVTRFIYHVPVFNKFRWPFRLAYFTSFFLIMVGTFGCSYALTAISRFEAGGRSAKAVCAVVILLLQSVNILVLYYPSPQRMFSRHYDQVPFSEPLKDTLIGGRIVSIGLDPPVEGSKTIYGNSLPQLGFNYATLWGLHHFAGYEVLVAADNLKASLDLDFRSVFNVDPEIPLNIPQVAPLEYLRNWGVKWYVVDSKLSLVPTDQLKIVYSDRFRNVLMDDQARPLVYWIDGIGTVTHRFQTNSIEITSERSSAGRLNVNILFNPFFKASIDGRATPLLRTADNQLVLDIPEGSHTISVRYHDQNFIHGVVVSLLTMLSLVLCGYVLKRRRFALKSAHLPR